MNKFTDEKFNALPDDVKERLLRYGKRLASDLTDERWNTNYHYAIGYCRALEDVRLIEHEDTTPLIDYIELKGEELK